MNQQTKKRMEQTKSKNIFSHANILVFMGSFFFISCSPYKKLHSFKSSYGTVDQMIHKKSGANLVLIRNEDQARGFAVNFKTPPYDDSGLFHIFEHAVLAGSRLYPSKSTFFNVSDSSIASFINAFTASDSTSYPFITRSPKDFDNLLSVYMDAVFFPKAIQDPRIVKREGWRYEVHPETKKMSVNGIVFNEMKGVFGNPSSHLARHLSHLLLPHTPYAHSSGGLPEKISTLRFEQIVSAHKEYYHPQNSLIFLYGKIAFKKTLSTIDKKFLTHFSKNKDFKSPEIPLQKDSSHYSSPPVVNAHYPGPKGLNKDFLAKGYVLGTMPLWEEDSLFVMLQAFVNNPVAPLKLKILKEGLATSVSATKLPGKDNAWSFVFQGTESSKMKQLENILQKETDKIIQHGLNPELLNSILNQWDFDNRAEKNQSHKALYLSSVVKNHWIHPQQLSLAEKLNYIARLKKTRQTLNDKNFIKNSFQKHFKDNLRFRWLIMKPDPKFSEKFKKTIETQVTEALKLKPLREYEKEDKSFRQWVAMKEPLDITNKTPLLKLADIHTNEKPIPVHRFKTESCQIMEYPQPTYGISYVQLYFDLKGVKEEDLKNLRFFIKLLKKTNTKNYSFQELFQQIQTYTGALSFNIKAYQSAKNPTQFKPLMRISLSFLNENREKSLSLLKEILLNSQFSPKDRAQNLLDELKTNIGNNISRQANSLSTLSAIKSFFPLKGSFEDETYGGLFLEHLLKSNLDSHQIVPTLQSLLGDIFNQKRLYLISSVADQNELKPLRAALKNLQKSLPTQSSKDQEWPFAHQKNYSAYAIPGEVQYLTEVASLKNQGLQYSGILEVYSKYVETHFMIPRFREQSGAYGAWVYPSRSGLWLMQTYRDPHLKNSFSSFSQIVDFMKKEKLNQEKLTPAILGALKTYYRDRSVSAKANLMTKLYLTDLSWDDYIQTKREILKTYPKSFNKINQALAHALKKSRKGVVGNSEKIKEEVPHFKEILVLP